MTAARRPNLQTQPLPHSVVLPGELGYEPAWPTALRALLMLSEAVHPADPALARLSDEDLALLRASLSRLNGGEPTSAA
jgi:hypothetical protein